MAFLETARPPVVLLSNLAQQFLRQYSSIPQTLAANNMPVVSGTSGLGTKGGAGLTNLVSNGSQGAIRVVPDKDATAGGNVALTFPSTPPTLFFGPDEAFGAISQATVGNVVTVTWTAAKFPGAGNGNAFNISFQWATAK